MSLENQQSDASDGKENQDTGKVESICKLYEDLIKASSLPKKDKDMSLNWLAKPPQPHKADLMEDNIAKLKEAEVIRKETLEKYDRKVDKKADADLIASDRESIAKWKKYVREMSTEDVKKFLDKDDLDKKEREVVLAGFKRLPSSVRKEKYAEFKKLGLEERQVKVAEWTKKHEELKARFVALPEEVQKKYVEKFKNGGFEWREALLKTMEKEAGVAGGPNAKNTAGAPESAEGVKLDTQYRAELKRLVQANLLAPDSEKAYGEDWFPKLSLAQKKQMLTGSEIHTRMGERKAALAEFQALPATVRLPLEEKFRHLDVDGRRALLLNMKEKNETQRGPTITYDKAVIDRTLHAVFTSSSTVQERASVYTIADHARYMRRKVEIETDAVHTDTIVERTEDQHREVDEHQTVDIEKLRYRREDRFAFIKNILRPKFARGKEHARHTNISLLDSQKREIGAQQFAGRIDHLESELVELLVDLAARKLPGIDKKILRDAAGKMDKHVDVLHAVAA